jgi:uncharacterized protein (DUF433 family)
MTMNVTGEGCGFFIVARRRPLSTWIADICSIGNTKPELIVFFFAQMFTFRYGLFELSLPDLVAVHDSSKIETTIVGYDSTAIVTTLSSAQRHPSGIINSIMVALEETISVPLTVTEQGTIRIKGSRVSLDSIIHHFKLGATAEQIVQSFPSLSLGDIYSSIAYYLTHRQEIEEYLHQQEIEADALQEQLESNPEYQAEIAELRSRIMGQWAAVRENGDGKPIA